MLDKLHEIISGLCENCFKSFLLISGCFRGKHPGWGHNSIQQSKAGETPLNIVSPVINPLQFTEEKLGRTERTEYDLDFQELEKKTDLTRSYTEKIKNNTAAVIVPNPGKQMQSE